VAQKYLKILLLALALTAWSAPARAQGKKRPQKLKPNAASRAKADIVKATESHKVNLQDLLALLEPDVKKAAEEAEGKKQLYALGLASKAEVARSEELLVKAKERVSSVQKQIVEADHLITEARAAEHLAMMPPPRVGSYNVTAALIRYSGPAGWALENVARVDSFFRSRFARALPVSALGQTAVHDRLGFDHRNAVDVAVHPDSPEGAALLDYLRSVGIPFIAFRQAVAGSATGAHIHIGYPSRRLFR
jgi:hypothetical protein